MAAALVFLGCLVTLTSAFNLPNRSPHVSSRLAFLSMAPKPAQHRTMLTLADRVAYQRVIEEVYWRHRIWPKERPDPKPSLDAVMTRAQLERKVADYLRDSQALEDYWQRPITAEQLQAEMERMAQQTKQPEVLRQLFAALGNDPFIIAECLARPVLAERVIAELYAHGRRFHSDPKRGTESGAETQATVTMAAVSASYALPLILNSSGGCIDDTWTPTTLTNAPAGRYNHTAVWTGSEMIIWGGLGSSSFFNTGGRYNPSTDSWTATSTTNAPVARGRHTAVWTGTEMIVWGGFSSGATFLNTGGRYSPTTDSWTATTTTNAPTARRTHTAVWTGTEMIVWGGSPTISTYLNTGGRYNPSTDSWVATSTTNAPTARRYHTAVWTGSEMIVWGGYFQDSMNHYWNTGGRYDPVSDNWTPTSTTNAPDGRAIHTAIWTGSQMVVWGGTFFDGIIEDLNTGGIYTPGTDSWTATSTTNVPGGRYRHTAVWIGSEMIVWGGTLDDATFLNTGGRYSLSTNTWTATSSNNAPSAREDHRAVWTGSQMIVWGGYDGGYVNTGGRYCAHSAPMVQSAVSRKTHGAAGTFDINMPLTGTSGVECRTGGATHDYSLVVTFSGNVTVTGMPQSQVVTGTGCVGSGGTCDPNGTVSVSGNMVTVPLTNIADIQVINVQINGVNGASDEPAVNVTIPMGFLTGDVNGNRVVNSTDVAQTKSQVGQNVGSANFREDVNASGTITATDVSIVKSDVGHALPP